MRNERKKKETVNTRFRQEWKTFMRKNNYHSIINAVNACNELKVFVSQPETISKFCNGSRDLSKTNLELFSKLFSVREEYLSGKDNFRTDSDVEAYQLIKASNEKAIHRILMNLGYADLYTDNNDYNITFPDNIRAFIEDIKPKLNDTNTTVMIDVHRDLYVSLSDEYEKLLYDEFLNFISFRLEGVFRNYSKEIPKVVKKDGTIIKNQNHQEIELVGGEKLIIDVPYLSTNTLLNNFDTKIVPEISAENNDDRSENTND